jgi:hypothetical protein
MERLKRFGWALAFLLACGAAAAAEPISYLAD